MKKLIFLLALILLFQNSTEAVNYAKLHMKELRANQNYGSTQRYFADYSEPAKSSNIGFTIKDPKLIKLGNYQEVSDAKYKEKLAKDNIKYNEIQKYLKAQKIDDYNTQAFGHDFYKVYRVCERVIRANKLDYVNWKIVLDTDNSFNASMAEANTLTINTGLFDTLSNNEDALAFIVGHELAHSMFGHYARKSVIYNRIEAAKRINSYEMYLGAQRALARESRKMELAADSEGAKLAVIAGYDLNKIREALGFLNAIGGNTDAFSSHPSSEVRLKNFAESKKYFMEDEWAKQGRYNLYNSDVLNCEKSSNRKTIVINRGKMRNQNDYYKVEAVEEYLTRLAYKSYLNGEFQDSEKYFKELLDINKNNYVAYLYMSYARECLYKQTGKKKHLEKAKEYAELAQDLKPDNKHIQQQILDL